MDNPTGAENAQEFDAKAREIAEATGWRISSADRAAIIIAQALREARREGMMRAAGILQARMDRNKNRQSWLTLVSAKLAIESAAKEPSNG